MGVLEGIKDAVACSGCDARRTEDELGPAWDTMAQFSPHEMRVRDVISTCHEAMYEFRKGEGESKMTVQERRELCAQRVAGTCAVNLSPVAVILNRPFSDLPRMLEEPSITYLPEL